MKKQIRLPIGFMFHLENRHTGEHVTAPQAFQGYDWRAWPNIPKGIWYCIEDADLPRNWDYTVGPSCRVIKWDDSVWKADEDIWNEPPWNIEEVL